MGSMKEIYAIAQNALQELRDDLQKKHLTAEEKIEFFEEFKDDIIEMLDIKIEKLKLEVENGTLR